jgi:acyl carrier protein
MLPSVMVYLDSLPKTANGKLDRKALPEPCWIGREFQPPHSETEQALAAIWQALLGVERVGLQDNFFELGGHSLLAMKLVGRIKQAAGVELPVRRIFETPQLAMMAAEIERLQQSISSVANLQKEISEALDQLQGLSADELQELLANENGI